MGIIRDSFICFKNWGEAIKTLPKTYRLETYEALFEYGTTGEIPENLSPVAKAMIVSFSTGMENSIAKYRACVENGKKGGNPNFKKGEPNPYYNQQNNGKDNLKDNPHSPKITKDNQTLPSDNLNVNVNDNVNVLKEKDNTVVLSKKKDNLKDTTDDNFLELKPSSFDRTKFEEFVNRFNIRVDSYDGGTIAQADFEELSSAYENSKNYLQDYEKHPASQFMSWICKNYKSIVMGKYRDKVEQKGKNAVDIARAAYERYKAEEEMENSDETD